MRFTGLDDPASPEGKPEVWRSRSCTVIGFLCGSSVITGLPSAPGLNTATFMSFNSGKYLSTRSTMESLPSSDSIMIASEANGLVIEAMRNMASSRMGTPVSGFCTPNVCEYATLPWRPITNTAPGYSPLAMPSCMRAARRCRRSVDKPTSSGRCARSPPPGTVVAQAPRLNAMTMRVSLIIFFILDLLP